MNNEQSENRKTGVKWAYPPLGGAGVGWELINNE